MTDADVGYGAKLQAGDGSSPESFTDIAEVTSISGPGLSAESVDLTHLNSPNNYMEFKAGMKNAGEVTMEGRWIPTDATLNDDSGGLLEQFEAQTTDTYKMLFPDGSDFTFSAFITAFEPNIGGHSDPVNLSVTFKVTGKPVLTQSA